MSKYIGRKAAKRKGDQSPVRPNGQRDLFASPKDEFEVVWPPAERRCHYDPVRKKAGIPFSDQELDAMSLQAAKEIAAEGTIIKQRDAEQRFHMRCVQRLYFLAKQARVSAERLAQAEAQIANDPERLLRGKAKGAYHSRRRERAQQQIMRKAKAEAELAKERQQISDNKKKLMAKKVHETAKERALAAFWADNG